MSLYLLMRSFSYFTALQLPSACLAYQPMTTLNLLGHQAGEALLCWYLDWGLCTEKSVKRVFREQRGRGGNGAQARDVPTHHWMHRSDMFGEMQMVPQRGAPGTQRKGTAEPWKGSSWRAIYALLIWIFPVGHGATGDFMQKNEWLDL